MVVRVVTQPVAFSQDGASYVTALTQPPFARFPGDICHRSPPPHRARVSRLAATGPARGASGQGPALVAARAARDPGPGRRPLQLEPVRVRPEQLLQFRDLQRYAELEGLVLRVPRRGELPHR